jgi:hypothetical protein
VGEVLSGRPVDNVNLREDAVIGRVDKWLARESAPHRMSDTLSALAEAAQRDTTVAGWIAETEAEQASFALGMCRPEACPRMTQQRSDQHFCHR